MRALVWITFAVLALLWTATAAAGAALAGWGAEALASGGAAQAARDVASLPVPEWVKLLLGPEWIELVQSFLRWAVDLGGGLLPAAGTVAGWLVPLVWITWAFGLLVLLAVAVPAHLLARRFGGRRLAGV